MVGVFWQREKTGLFGYFQWTTVTWCNEHSKSCCVVDVVDIVDVVDGVDDDDVVDGVDDDDVVAVVNDVNEDDVVVLLLSFLHEHC